MCLLTFDDGLKDHYSNVLPVLVEMRTPGLFFLITSCIEEKRIAAVHKNHLLMAELQFNGLRQEVMKALSEQCPEIDTAVGFDEARRSYRWDSPEVAVFKYIVNFRAPASARDEILETLFARYLGDERDFASDLYMTWPEAREMQSLGMVIGGHSHNHVALATLDHQGQRADVRMCAQLLKSRLQSQELWPFSYPYGKRNTFNRSAVAALMSLGFGCAFSTEVGTNAVGEDLFCLRRIDPKDLHQSNIFLTKTGCL